MRRIVRLVIIIEVAANAGIGSTVVVVVVAIIAVAYRCMGTFQNIIIVMIREQCRIPSRIGSVAGGAFSRQIQGCVAGICGLVVVTGMTATAGIRGGIVVPVMASCTVIGNNGMSSC